MFSEEMICSLNDLELEVYKYVVRNADKVCYMRIREFADAAHVSTSTILRFCKKAGCDGYAEFKIRLRQTALAAASSALIAGTTEPALYGVAVRLKRPLIASLITGFICGCLAGMAGLASRSMVSPSVLTGVQFIDPANPGVSIAWIAGISVLSIVLSFVLTLVIGFEDLPEEE